MNKSKSEIEIAELSKKHAPHFSKKRKCRVEGCNRFLTESLLKEHRWVCSHHRYKQRCRSNPVALARCYHKRNSESRKIGYSLSRRHWYYLNFFTFYWKKKGRRPESLTIDRIDNGRGYSDDNVQVADMRYNATKQNCKDLWEE